MTSPDQVLGPTSTMTAAPRAAQPIGAFPFPAGLLLVPTDTPGTAAACASLVAGRLPAPWPDALRTHEHAHADDAAGALAAITGNDPVSRYNRWVLDPESASVDDVRSALDPAYAGLVDAIAWSLGLVDEPPSVDATAPVEVRGLVLATLATGLLETGDVVGAVRTLHEAAEAASGTALSAVLRGNAGTLSHEHQLDRTAARADLSSALEALAHTDLALTRAELHYQLGGLIHEEAAATGDSRDLLQQAMQHYYLALRLVTETSAPYLWASAQLNLATAHLATPMTQASDQLRYGVATQALRACRRVFHPDEHPGPWSTATLNLANALVYTPSTHQGDNLVEAVELYEEVLASGAREGDPVGRARLLSNQGNVLAHLGMFEPARARLVEARYIFEEHLDHDAAMTVRGVLDEIAKAGVADPGDAAQELARKAGQMARLPQTGDPYTSGMGVQVTSGGSLPLDLPAPPPKPKVTVLATRPRTGPHGPQDGPPTTRNQP